MPDGTPADSTRPCGEETLSTEQTSKLNAEGRAVYEAPLPAERGRGVGTRLLLEGSPFTPAAPARQWSITLRLDTVKELGSRVTPAGVTPCYSLSFSQ